MKCKCRKLQITCFQFLVLLFLKIQMWKNIKKIQVLDFWLKGNSDDKDVSLFFFHWFQEGVWQNSQTLILTPTVSIWLLFPPSPFVPNFCWAFISSGGGGAGEFNCCATVHITTGKSFHPLPRCKMNFKNITHICFFSQSHMVFFISDICFFPATYVLQRKFTFKATERLNFQRAGEVPVVLVCSLEGVGGGLEAWIGWVGGAHWGDLEAWIVGNWCRRKVATATTHTTKSWHQDISKLSL